MCSWSLASEPFTRILLRGARRAPRWCGHESSLGLSKKAKITVELRGPVGKSVPSLWGWESLEYPMMVCLGVCVCVRVWLGCFARVYYVLMGVSGFLDRA